MKSSLLKNLSLTGLLISCGMAFAVYETKNQVVGVEKELNTLNGQIIETNETIHTLKAEWSYLNTPQRLNKLNKKFLNLQPTAVKQIASAKTMPTVLAAMRKDRYSGNKIIVADINPQPRNKRS